MINNHAEKLVWHYTTLDTLEKILNSQSLLATEANFQNDLKEVSYARGVIKAALIRAGERHEGLGSLLLNLSDHLDDPGIFGVNLDGLLESSRFLLCGSSDGDSMYCWRTYGDVGTVGCAIGLDQSVQLGVKEAGGLSPVSWHPVSYSSEEMQDEVDTLVDGFVKEYVESGSGDRQRDFGELITGYSELQTRILSSAKSPSYADEKEFRITVRSPPASAIRFGAGKSGPRPRIALTTVGPTEGGPSDDEKALPIRAVRLGPTAPRGAERSLRWVLAAHGYALDGVYEYGDREDENGDPTPDMWLNTKRKVRILSSDHEFQDV